MEQACSCRNYRAKFFRKLPDIEIYSKTAVSIPMQEMYTPVDDTDMHAAWHRGAQAWKLEIYTH